MQKALFDLSEDFGGGVGIAVYDLRDKWLAGVAAEEPFPQQSVSKLWVAIAFLDKVDRGEVALEDEVLLTDADRSVFFQPIAEKIRGEGYRTTFSNLLSLAVITSDNLCNDRLMKEVGGPEAVDTLMKAKSLPELGVGAYERDLQAGTAGLTWSYDYGFGQRFEQARARLPREARQAAADRYLQMPLDGATPYAIVKGLSALAQGKLLSDASTDTLLALMSRARTGPLRLRGGLPPGWFIAHKTGTGQDWRGGSMGINDVGLIRAPDGRLYAVACMIRFNTKPVPERLAFMQAVTRAVADEWRAGEGPSIVAQLEGALDPTQLPPGERFRVRTPT